MNKFKAILKTAYDLVVGWLPNLTRRAWVSLAIPLILMLAFVIAVGPETQRAIFSALNSTAPSPYDALYGDAITPFPSLLTWLSTAFWWPFLVIASVAMVASLKATNFRLVLFSVALWTAALLTLLDILGSFGTDGFTLPAQIANVTANAAGSIAVALITAVALVLYHTIRTALKERPYLSLVVASSAVIMTGVVVSTTVHYGLRFVYEPLPARVTAVLSPPASGWFLGHQPPDRPTLNLEGYPAEDFDFIGPVDSSSRISVEARGLLSATWNREDSIRTYDVEARFLLDCMHQGTDEVPAGPSIISRRSVDSVRVTTNEGKGRIQVASGATPSVRLLAASMIGYTMERDEDDRRSVTFFTPGEDQLRIEDDAHFFLISANLFQATGTTSTAIPRTITIQIGNEILVYTFRPTSMGAENSQVICHRFDSATPGDIDVGSAMNAAIVVRITPSLQNGPVRSYARESLMLRLGQGWTSVSGLRRDTTQSEPRFVSFISVIGGLQDVRLNGQEVDFAPYETLAALGNFRTQTLGDGRVYIQGQARAAWRGSARVNETRWDAASDWSVWLAGAFLGMIAALSAWFWPRMVQFSEEDPRNWSD